MMNIIMLTSVLKVLTIPVRSSSESSININQSPVLKIPIRAVATVGSRQQLPW